MNHFGYLSVVMSIFIINLVLRKITRLQSLGKTKQIFIFFIMTYILGLTWDTIAVASKHWQYKNMIGVYIGYSPVENIAFAVAFPLAVITTYQIIDTYLLKKR